MGRFARIAVAVTAVATAAGVVASAARHDATTAAFAGGALTGETATTTAPRAVTVPTAAPAVQVKGVTIEREPAAVTTTTVAQVAKVRQLLFDGQSFNYAATKGSILTYPAQLLGLLSSKVPLSSVVGISATTYAMRNETVAQRVDSRLSPSRQTIILDIAGQSDIYNGLAAGDVLAAAERYADARRRAGAAYVVEFTVPPSTLFTGAREAQRRSYNKMLLANANKKFAAVVDIAGAPEFTNPLNLLFLTDGLHPTDAGAAVIAKMAQPVVDALFARG